MSFLQTSVAEKASVQVAVRIRPLNIREDGTDIITDTKDSIVYLKNPDEGKKKTFAYDYAFNIDTAQDALFSVIGEKVIDNAFRGYNCCIFAYGQSGSGKTFTMMGDSENLGLIPKICQALYDRQENSNGLPIYEATVTYKVELSYMEIYSEEVQDLLVKTRQANGLRVRQHPEFGPYVEGLSQVLVENYASIKKLIDQGNKARTTASTGLNDRSSRSHAILTLYFTQLIDEPGLGKRREVVSKINLVDLAGSERVEASGVTGINFKEAININKSLSTLGLIISKLAEQSVQSAKHHDQSPSPTAKGSPKASPKRSPRASPIMKKLSSAAKKKGSPLLPSRKSIVKGDPTEHVEHVPFRDSTLTWILRDSLGGNSKTYMIATVSPSAMNYSETLSTLRYASNAKQIINTVKINEDPSDKLIRVLKGEIDSLRLQLATKGGDSTTSAAELKQLKDDLAQREALMAEKDKTWEQKLAESKRINEEVQDQMKQELATKQIEFRKKLELMNVERETYLREMETLKFSMSEKELEQQKMMEEELAKKQADFEKGRILDTATSLQKFYETKLEEKVDRIKKEYETKIAGLISPQDLLKSQMEIDTLKASNARLREELTKSHNSLQQMTQHQSTQHQAERALLSRQIQQLHSKIAILEGAAKKSSPESELKVNLITFLDKTTAKIVEFGKVKDAILLIFNGQSPTILEDVVQPLNIVVQAPSPPDVPQASPVPSLVPSLVQVSPFSQISTELDAATKEVLVDNPDGTTTKILVPVLPPREDNLAN
jgi:hypothetical protein